MEVGSDSSSSWIPATNWKVIHGSLNHSLSFETPFSEDTQVESNTPKDHLQLVNPPSSNSSAGPCEITISFSQRHEIRQVYVRSTARVYEIYYASDEKSSNEYLCTVRCSDAVDGDSTLHESETEERSTGTVEIPAEKSRNGSSNGTTEDDWIEVKTPDSPFPASSTTTKNNRNGERIVQDLYEATAEITDADPCISITIRLLSLQTPGNIHIEEIYVFGEPVEPSESEHQGGPSENSAGNSLMAMLVPTLLQLSKSRNSTQEKNASNTTENLKYKDAKSKETSLPNPNFGNMKQQEAQPSILNGVEKEVDKVNKDSTGQGPEFVNKEISHYSNRIERVLNHLVARVVRLEAFCLRFEEKMLEPISNIETKLGRLEKQLEVLTTRSQISEFNPGTRITAPEFSCSDSITSSFHNDGNKTGMRITAPEFSCSNSLVNSFCNDENDTHLPEGSKYESKDDPCTRTIADETLIHESEPEFFNDDETNKSEGGVPASAHTDVNVGDSSSQFCPGLVVRAPEFSSDNDAEGGENGDSDEKNCTEVFESAETTSSVLKPSLSIEAALASALVGFLSTTSVQPSDYHQNLEVKTSDCVIEAHSNSRSVIPSDEAPYPESISNFSKEDELQVIKLTNGSPNETAVYENWFSDPKTASPGERPQLDMQFFSEKSYDDASETITLNDLSATEIQDNSEHKKADLENVLKRTYSSTVDFELPILDVTFVPQENYIAKSSLEALLDVNTESDIVSCVKNDANTNGVISAEGSSHTPDDQLLIVGMEDFAVKVAVPNDEVERVEDTSACTGYESFADLI